ncbi:MAG: type I restriction-modification system subunit M [Bellilinea sp.]
MALKKSELYSSLWKSCDELRGGMDASQYKDYVLVLLFVKYVSDKYTDPKKALIKVPKGGSFTDMVMLKGQKDIGDQMNKIIAKLAEANDLKGVIDQTDFNDEGKLGRGKEMQERLSNLVAIFENSALDFSKNRAEGDDLLGDAYEYLMRNFATESGKSKGQFYTPAEVSRVMAKIIGISSARSANTTIYDPTCGSGSLLLKAADEAKIKISIYGQEMDNATAALARMNMILHDNPEAEIWNDNSLSTPHWIEKDGRLKAHDFVVANPPFSTKAWRNGFDPEHDLFERFEDGLPPSKNGDYAFLLHLIKSMKSNGKGAIILPHGVLFRGNAEGEIRKNLVLKGYIKGIIGLPPNLFYGTSIPACIVVLEKENATERKGIFIVDASKGFMKDGNKNRLRHQDIHKIVDVFNHLTEIPNYSRMVPYAEIGDPKNDFNLNLPRYIDSADIEDIQDISAHLLGGIPNRDIENLSEYWDVFNTLRDTLFEEGTRPGYSQIRVKPAQIKSTISSQREFIKFTEDVTSRFDKWIKSTRKQLHTLEIGFRPRDLINTISEELLLRFADFHLIDPYDLYQHLMTYWTDIMQDDVYMIATEGWVANEDLLPSNIVINRHFDDEQTAIQKLQAEQEALFVQMEELTEEICSEDGQLSEVVNEKGKLTNAILKAYLNEIDANDVEAKEKASKYLKLIEFATDLGKKKKAAQKILADKVTTKYSSLSEDEIKLLVIDDKWLGVLKNASIIEVDRIGQNLEQRITELERRYVDPLIQLTSEIEKLRTKVMVHLEKIGYLWE